MSTVKKVLIIGGGIGGLSSGIALAKIGCSVEIAELNNEFNLVLEKLLCNVDFEEPVPNYIVLTDKEKEESTNLLEAITRHWEPLNRTSIDGLRTSFFQREGKLINKETGWLLRVEQKTIEVC